jgi:hypothetical protein
MWVFTIDGFYSAVRHNELTYVMQVRARDRDDLTRLIKRLRKAESPNIIETPEGDYPYRINLHQTYWIEYLADAVKAVDYGNFKEAVAKTRGHHRANLYLRVWSAMRGLSDG